jgi:mono/diheme cytochrome c family protein
MLKNLFFIALAAAVASGFGYAQSTSNVVIPVEKTSAASGKQMYVNYCAPCHGVDGRGNGPVAAALKQQPADLALLSKNNGGKFPSIHVESILQFGTDNPSHGNAQMPVWGPVFTKMNTATPQTDVTMLRISNLSRYLETLQAK